MAKLTIEVSAEEFDKAIDKAYQKNKGKMAVPGFRKGKVPRQMIEKMYGVGVFYEDAANEIIPEAYEAELENCELEIVSQPKIDVVQIEKGKSFIFTAEVAVKPEVELGKYTGFDIEKPEVEVTDDEVNAELDRAREQQARTIPVEDRAVMDGDMTVIDFEGFVDGVPFEGGKGTDYSLTIGSHSFIDTFEEQLIGKAIGEEVEVNVTFPEEYHAEELKGKPALFKVTVKEIKVKELPELDDDFAQDVSEFDTLDEYKKDIRAKLEKNAEDRVKRETEDAAVEFVVSKMKVNIPNVMIENRIDEMVREFEMKISYQGLNLETYLQYAGLEMDKLREQMKEQAENQVKSMLALEAMAKREKVKVSKDEIEEEYAKLAAEYKVELDQIKSYIAEDDVKKSISTNKTIDVLMKKVNYVEKAADAE